VRLPVYIGATFVGAALLGATPAFAAAAPAASPQAVPQLGAAVTVSHLQGSSGTVIVQRASGAPAAAVELWFRAPSIGFGDKPVPGLARVAAQTVAGSKPIVGPSLGDRIEAVGGHLAIIAYADSLAVAALVPADAAPEIVKAMTIAYFSPVISEEGFSDAVRDVAMEALISGFDPATVVRNDAFGQLFANGPDHYPVLGSAKDVSAVTLTLVRGFAERAFRAQNAVLVVSGAVSDAVLAGASRGRPVQANSPFELAETPISSVVSTSLVPVREHFDEAAAGYAWAGPPIGREDEATAMDFIADYLFRPGAGVASRAVEEQMPGAFVTGQFITLHNPGVMFVAFGDGDLTKLRPIVDRSLAQMRTALSAERFSSARDAFEYHLLSDLQTPTEMADNFGWYSVEGNLPYAPGADGKAGRYFAAAAALTPEFVAQVAEKYLTKTPASVILVPNPPKSSAAKGQPS